MVVLVPGVLAFVFGWLAFRSRVTGVYLSIITQAMTYALLLAFFRNDMGFGGNNGLTDFKDILGFNVQADATRAILFAITAIVLAVGFLVAQLIVTSKFGKVLIAIRDAESRTRFIGYRVENYKLFVFTLSAVMAGIAGALYVPQVGIINPREFSPANSIEAVIWVAIGGRGTLVGAALGAVIVNMARPISPALCPNIGFSRSALLFILVTLFLPQGIVGTHLGRRTIPPAPKGSDVEEGKHRSTDVPAAGEVDHGSGDPYPLAALSRRNRRLVRRLQGVARPVADAQPGEMRAIIGPNGAGKTTMMDVITGKTRPDEGDVYFGGSHDLTQLDEAAIAELGIGRKFQKPTVFESHTVEDNILLALKAPRQAPPRCSDAPRGTSRPASIDILETVHLTDHRNRYAADLSHGQKQWLEIGMLLAQDPKLLLVDEPVAGMTDSETVQTAILLKAIARIIRSSSSSTTWILCASSV